MRHADRFAADREHVERGIRWQWGAGRSGAEKAGKDCCKVAASEGARLWREADVAGKGSREIGARASALGHVSSTRVR